MRRVDANGAGRAALQADEGAGLGAVAVQHVRLQLADQPGKMRPHHHVDRHRLAPDREAVHAELEARRDRGKGCFRTLAPGQAVGDDPDMMAAIRLAVGEVEDMAKNPADRGAGGVQDTKRLIGAGHDQNRRRRTIAVASPAQARPPGTARERRGGTARGPRIGRSMRS